MTNLSDYKGSVGGSIPSALPYTHDAVKVYLFFLMCAYNTARPTGNRKITLQIIPNF